MTIELSMKAEGLEEIKSILDQLSKVGSEYRGVRLNGIKRTENADNDNGEILEWLKESGRDFVSVSSEDAEKIAQVAVDELEDRTSKALKRAQRAAGKGLKGAERKSAMAAVTTFEKGENWSRQTAAAVLKVAMKEYMEIVQKRIENQDPASGELKPLSPRYREWKEKNYGFDTIGKLTGQLMDNLDPATSEKAIKVFK